MQLKAILLLVNIAIALCIVVFATRKSKVPGAISLAILSLFIMIWSVSYLLFETFPNLISDRFLIAILFFSITSVASVQLAFCLSYTNHPSGLTRPVIILLIVIPLVTQLLYWAKPWSAILFLNNGTFESSVFSSMWGRIVTFYVYTLVGASVLLLLDMYIRKPRSLFFRTWTILAGAMFPTLIQVFNIIGLNLLSQNATQLLAFTFAELGFSYGLFSQKAIETVPVTREAVVEGMEDGWVVLNAQNVVVDINPAAENIVGVSRDKLYGQPITSIMGELPNLAQALSGIQELEMKRSLKSQQGWRYLNIRMSTIKNQKDQDAGHLIIWRDITKRKFAEDARQRARDEMFVLLNAISSAASNAIDLDDFLSESIYQIVHPFRSQIVAVFLMEERSKEDGGEKLFLASHFGLPTDSLGEDGYVLMSNPVVEWIFANRQALLIEDVQNNPRLPYILQKIAFSSLLVTPLFTQAGEDSKFVGLIYLVRKEGPVFSQDEIVRLTMISDHIATLIDSDRRRKLAIALSERQRLLRDLHDSVSQKLYGLVTLTEAAQAALEAGSSVNPTQVLVKIGENARQAVKEMRLFLYQMQPVEIEKDGLISVMHHRLAAVEGRADIKARLLADEDISLSIEKEVALYYIAQEALNNVLRHAHARSITVSLKQGKRNVILEILDDGIGFDLKSVDRNGLGLRNMKERTLQTDGKFKVTSKPGGGTKIRISVPRDQSVKSISRRR